MMVFTESFKRPEKGAPSALYTPQRHTPQGLWLLLMPNSALGRMCKKDGACGSQAPIATGRVTPHTLSAKKQGLTGCCG